MTDKPNDVRVSRDLLPCPFCNAEPHQYPSVQGVSDAVTCTTANCPCDQVVCGVSEWNARAQPADQQDEPVAITELRHIFDCNKGADRTLVISKKLAAQLLADQPATAKVDEHKLNIVVDKVDDICEKFEMENQHSHPTYKRLKRLHYELASAKLSGSQS